MATAAIAESEHRNNEVNTSSRKPVRTFSFADRWTLQSLIGPCDQNIGAIEKITSTRIRNSGLEISVDGDIDSAQKVEEGMRDLYRRIECGETVGASLIETVFADFRQPSIKNLAPANDPLTGPVIHTKRKKIFPRSENQRTYMTALARSEMTFGIGPAGTGKTYLAVAQAVSMLFSNQVKRLIISRPAVEAGEKLGFLPGDMKDKVDPYLRPIYDALYDCMPSEQVERRLESGEIEVAPLAFMRGRTLSDAYIILDEAQNTTPAQMKMFLTRFGESSRMVINGDPNQTDLPGGMRASGLADAVDKLAGVEGITICRFTGEDVVRHPIVRRIVQAYDDPTL